MRVNRNRVVLGVIPLLAFICCLFQFGLIATGAEGDGGQALSSRGGAVLGVGQGTFDLSSPNESHLNGSFVIDVENVDNMLSEADSLGIANGTYSNSAEERSSLDFIDKKEGRTALKDNSFLERDIPLLSGGDSVVKEESVFDSNITSSLLLGGPETWFHSDKGWFGREGLETSLKTILIMSAFTVAPAILLMTTSYVRISIVLFLLRQALGIGQVPSNQVIATFAIFLTMLVMSPVGIEIYKNSIVPYSQGAISQEEAFTVGQEPLRTFLWKQIERTGNVETVNLFAKYLPDVDTPEYYEDVPWRALAPAFLLSELKTSFLIGFQVLLPFLVIDLVVSCVLVSTGMMMLPPAIVSLPFKLALFVLVDGWSLVVKSLLESFA